MKRNVILAALAFTFIGAASSHAVVYDNSSKLLASGDFFADGSNEVAYIKTDGTVFVHDFSNGQSQAISGVTASQIVAADLDGDGRDELAFINAASQQLQSFNFSTQSLTTHPVSPVGAPTYQTLGAGNIDGIVGHELMVGSSTGELSIYLPQTNTFFLSGGSIQSSGRITNGELIGGNAGDEFLVRNTTTPPNQGTPFVYNFATNAFTNIGGNADEVITGNIFTSDATEEVYVNNFNLGLFLNNNSVFNQYVAGGAGIALGAGRMDGDLAAGQDLFYVIGSVNVGNRIYTMRPDQAEFAALVYTLLKEDASDFLVSPDVANNFGWGDLILADIDNDGLDELVLRKLNTAGDPDSLYIFQNGDQDFLLASPTFVPEPTSLGLMGVLSLSLFVRRRRVTAN